MSVFAVVKRKHLIVSAVAALAVLVIVLGVTLGTQTAQAERKLPIYCVEDDHKIAITFDASWGAERTKGIVDALYERGLKATFFLTGIWIAAYPKETIYIHDHGMEIGNHSAHHYNMGKMSNQDCMEEISSVNRQVRDLTGVYPTVFRAPFGDYGDVLIDTLESMGMRCIQWDVDSLDWKGLGKDELYRRITQGVKGGSIILCHNNSDHILEALPDVLDDLTKAGYQFVIVSELIANKQGTLDHQGKLHAARQGG